MDKQYEYNKSEEYNEKIAPLVEQLRKECYFLKIPMFFTAAVQNNQSGTDYKTEMISAMCVDAVLQDDKVAKLTNVMNGFETRLPAQITELEYD